MKISTKYCKSNRYVSSTHIIFSSSLSKITKVTATHKILVNQKIYWMTLKHQHKSSKEKKDGSFKTNQSKQKKDAKRNPSNASRSRFWIVGIHVAFIFSLLLTIFSNFPTMNIIFIIKKFK